MCEQQRGLMGHRWCEEGEWKGKKTGGSEVKAAELWEERSAIGARQVDYDCKWDVGGEKESWGEPTVIWCINAAGLKPTSSFR